MFQSFRGGGNLRRDLGNGGGNRKGIFLKEQGSITHIGFGDILNPASSEKCT